MQKNNQINLRPVSTETGLARIKAFTLVELIVVITILAILGTIAFINLSGYSTNARDGKRVSDVNNIMKKIGIESSKGTSLSTLITTTKTNLGLTINGNSGSSIQGTANFATLKEDGSKFKDPVTNGDYVLSYSVGGTGTGAYKFIQISTVNEELNQAVVKGNYYLMQVGDSPSIIYNPDSTYFVVDGGVDLSYNIDNSVLVTGCVDSITPTSESYFTFDNINGEITGYSPSGPKDVIIPCMIGGHDVKSIGMTAFFNLGINSVLLNKNIINIGGYAFGFNNITNLIIPNSVISIESNAFYNNDITSLNLSNGLEEIYYAAFAHNLLTNVTIPTTVNYLGETSFDGNPITSVINYDGVYSDQYLYAPWNGGVNILRYMGGGTGVVIPGILNGKEVKSIGWYSFNNLLLESVVIPYGVTSIGNNAFSNNKLISVTIPSTVGWITSGSFTSQNGSVGNGTVYGPPSGYVKNTYTNNGPVPYFDKVKLPNYVGNQ
ncbi:MAG: leucine-rich repeat protein [Candidatus Gracilibacteria bacterium]|nr:leucine-rich repeat protein [Candidatus Gracilibacteria bacterium]